MSYYCKIQLDEESCGNLSFYYSFNEKDTFNDLLEYVLYHFPEKNICPCFKFQYSEEKGNSEYIEVEPSTTIAAFIINKKYLFKIVNAQPDKECHCDELLKEYYKKSKADLIDIIQKNIENHKQKEINLLNEKNTLEKENKENINKIYELECENKNLKQEINNLNLEKENNIKALKENENEINALQKKIELLEAAINGDTETINQLKKVGLEGKLTPKDIIKIDSNSNKIIGTQKLNSETKFIDFYDVIIDIKSIKDICKGWEIKMSKRAEEKYLNLTKEKIIKVGVIGNSNKGKSFLLSKLSKIDLPSGTSIRTEGLSIKYPELELFKDRKIALLDSAGLETPVLKEENPENKNVNEEKSDKEMFKEKSREKLITELFLQNYIINNTDILIVVIGILTYSEQKLLNRIKTEIQRAKLKKPLYIIHNLITYITVAQVKEYIDTTLLKSATFNLEEGHKISTQKESKKGVYYYEKNYDPKIYHLIFANEDSEAGIYYNNFTLDFLESEYQRVTDLTSYDVIKTIKERFIEISKEFIEKLDNPLNKNDFDNSNNKLIKLNNINNITLKKCLIDELGFSNLKSFGFEPTYNYYKKNDKIIVRVEAPGNSTIKSSIHGAGEYTFIRLKGDKKRDKEPSNIEDNLFNSREIGEFSLDIPLKSEDFLIKNESPKIEAKKGVLILEYQLEEKVVDKGFNVDEEDEI